MSTTVTEREAVMRERAAVRDAVEWMRRAVRREGGIEHVDARDLPNQMYPLPKVQRPRVLTLGSLRLRLIDNRLQWRTDPGVAWWCSTLSVVDFSGYLESLRANPTELVDDDGFQGVRDGGDTT